MHAHTYSAERSTFAAENASLQQRISLVEEQLQEGHAHRHKLATSLRAVIEQSIKELQR